MISSRFPIGVPTRYKPGLRRPYKKKQTVKIVWKGSWSKARQNNEEREKELKREDGLTRFDDSSGKDEELSDCERDLGELEQKETTPVLFSTRKSGRKDVDAVWIRRRLGPGRDRNKYRVAAKLTAIEGSRRVSICFLPFVEQTRESWETPKELYDKLGWKNYFRNKGRSTVSSTWKSYNLEWCPLKPLHHVTGLI